MKRIIFWGVTLIAVVCVLMPVSSFAKAKWTIKFGHDHKLSSPHHAAALMIKERLESGSSGEIQVTVFPDQTLGTGVQMVEMLQAGAIQMLGTATSQVQPIHPPMQVLSLPFLFKTKEDFYRNL